MNREEAARIYIDGLLLLKNIGIKRFFEAAEILSEEDKRIIQVGIGKYAANLGNIQREEEKRKGGDKE